MARHAPLLLQQISGSAPLQHLHCKLVHSRTLQFYTSLLSSRPPPESTALR